MEKKKMIALLIWFVFFGAFSLTACAGIGANNNISLGSETLSQGESISSKTATTGGDSNTEECNSDIPFTKEEAQKKYIDPLWKCSWQTSTTRNENEKGLEVKVSALTADDLMNIYVNDGFLGDWSDDPEKRPKWIDYDETTGSAYISAGIVEQYLYQRFGVDKEVVRQATWYVYDVERDCYVIKVDGFGGAPAETKITNMEKEGDQILLLCQDTELRKFTVTLVKNEENYVVYSWSCDNYVLEE